MAIVRRFVVMNASRASNSLLRTSLDVIYSTLQLYTSQQTNTQIQIAYNLNTTGQILVKVRMLMHLTSIEVRHV